MQFVLNFTVKESGNAGPSAVSRSSGKADSSDTAPQSSFVHKTELNIIVHVFILIEYHFSVAMTFQKSLFPHSMTCLRNDYRNSHHVHVYPVTFLCLGSFPRGEYFFSCKSIYALPYCSGTDAQTGPASRWVHMVSQIRTDIVKPPKRESWWFL